MCTGAAAGLVVVANAEIEITSSYSRDRVKHIKRHLEKVYGKGFTLACGTKKVDLLVNVFHGLK